MLPIQQTHFENQCPSCSGPHHPTTITGGSTSTASGTTSTDGKTEARRSSISPKVVQPVKGWNLSLNLVTVAVHSSTWEIRTVQKACHILPHPPMQLLTSDHEAESCSEGWANLGAQLRLRPPSPRQVMGPHSHLIGRQREVLEGPQVPEIKARWEALPGPGLRV